MDERTLKNIRDAVALYQVENGLGNHCYLHAAGYFMEHSLLNNSMAEDHTVAHGFGGFVGPVSDWTKWHSNQTFMAMANHRALLKIYPQVKDIPAHTMLSLNEAAIHTQATSIVECAEDGQTVRISLYTPGIIFSVLNPNEKKQGSWLWERYGIEYKLEDGVWREWRTMICPDFSGHIDAVNWGRAGYEADCADRDGKNPPRPSFGPPVQPEIPAPCHISYSATVTPYDTAPWPQPYETIRSEDRLPNSYYPETVHP